MTKRVRLVSRLDLEPLRRAFPKEAHHFTTWLESNIEALSERLDINRRGRPKRSLTRHWNGSD